MLFVFEKTCFVFYRTVSEPDVEPENDAEEDNDNNDVFRDNDDSSDRTTVGNGIDTN